MSEFSLQFNQHQRLPFTRAEYMRRYELVISMMLAQGIDALLIRGPENITYLTGYETPGYYGYHCLILARDAQPVLVGRQLELATNVPEFSWLTTTRAVDDHESPVEVTIDVVRSLRLERAVLGVETGGWFFTVNEYQALQQAATNARFQDSTALVEQARMIKSEEEVSMIRRATAIADRAVMAGIKAVEPCVTEDEVAAAVHKVWCEEGAEYTGLPNFIQSGRRSGICHSTWRGRRIEQNDWCCFEIAAAKNRYSGAIYRAVTVGEPDPEFLRLVEACRDSLETTLEAIRPGVTCEDVWLKGHAVFEKCGFGENHRHRIGYSMGVNFPPDWGEGQIISLRKGEQRVLQENMCFHVTPSLLLLNRMGSALTATVRVSANGCEVLNTVPRILFRK